MWIKHCQFVEENLRNDPVVQGHIEIEGVFSRAEWEKIKVTFIAMGLAQAGRHRPLSRLPGQQMPRLPEGEE